MKMDCKKADELMMLYTDGEMPGALGRHIEECPRCRSSHEETLSLIHRLRSDEAPEPPEKFWGRLRADVRRGIRGQERAGASVSKEGRSSFTLMGTPLWQRVLAPAMLVIAFVSAYMLYAPGYRMPDRVEAPALLELAEADVEIYMEMDEDEAAITSMIVETDEFQDSVYSELYGMEEEELANFYDSLGQMMESIEGYPGESGSIRKENGYG